METLNLANNHKIDVVSVRLVKDAPILFNEPITCPEDAVRCIGQYLQEFDRECVCAVYLKTNGVPISMSMISMGSLNASMIEPREVFKAAILANASSMLLLHNHPSGSVTPSRSDVIATNRMIDACTIIGIPLQDHIIVGNNTYFSFREKALISMEKCKEQDDIRQINFDKKII